MENDASASPVILAPRVPKRARKVPKKAPAEYSVEKLLTMLAFIGGVLLVRFLGAVEGLLFAVLVGVVLLVRFVILRARRQEGILPPSAKIR